MNTARPFDLQKLDFKGQRLAKRRRLIRWTIAPTILLLFVGLWFTGAWLFTAIGKNAAQDVGAPQSAQYLKLPTLLPYIQPSDTFFNYATGLSLAAEYNKALPQYDKALAYASNDDDRCRAAHNLVLTLEHIGDDAISHNTLLEAQRTYTQALTRISQNALCFSSSSIEDRVQQKLDAVTQTIAQQGGDDSKDPHAPRQHQATKQQQDKLKEVQQKAERARSERQATAQREEWEYNPSLKKPW